MIRLIGFLFGVALALVLLAAFVDTPSRERAGVLVQDSVRVLLDAVGSKDTKREAVAAASAIDSTIAKGREEARLSPSPVADPRLLAAATTSESEPLIARANAPIVDGASGNSAPLLPPEPPAALPAGQLSALNELSGPVNQQPGWQPLWRAFRSELSAKGFAAHLRRLTGQRYRVRRAASWAYQVELAYRDERQRDAVLQDIQTKTGLGLTGSQP